MTLKVTQTSSGPPPGFLQMRWPLPQQLGPSLAELQERDPLPRAMGVMLSPSGPEGRVSNQRGLFLRFQISWNLPSRFWTCLGMSFLFFFQFLPFGLGISNLCQPHRHTLGLITCLFTEFHRCKGILLPDESYLQSHSYLIQIFR